MSWEEAARKSLLVERGELRAERERLHHALAEARLIIDRCMQRTRPPIRMVRAARDRIDGIVAGEVARADISLNDLRRARAAMYIGERPGPRGEPIVTDNRRVK